VPDFALPIPARPGVLERPDSDALVRRHFEFVWRLLRRLGLPESDADDAAQQVFLIAVSKLDLIAPGSERAFLYGCALNQAAKWRSAQQRPRQAVSLELLETAETAQSHGDVEEALDRRRARALLDSILEQMSPALRVVFVLFELEQLSTVEIAEIVSIPRGTVASRLRRARDEFQKHLRRFEACWPQEGIQR
jgi:RNA polymerase sigma-70 factor (ECF subfamily)